jgi:DNA-binding response OmpR family regulator
MMYKLLVVDDDQEICQTTAKLLSKHDYEVLTAFDGEEALEKIRQEAPDIVLLDLMMPKLNGFDVLKEIREHYKEKWIPVIIISAQTDLKMVSKSYDLEADHYLTKPCTIENILNGIRTMISLIPLRREST